LLLLTGITRSTPEKTLSVSQRGMTGIPTAVASLMACQSALGSVTSTTCGSACFGCSGLDMRPGMNRPTIGMALVSSANLSIGVLPWSLDETDNTLHGSKSAMKLVSQLLFSLVVYTFSRKSPC